jgi:pyruvate dehydrogenase E1 component alpha subunit
MTYRLSPHGAADFLERYRSKDEIAEARKRDPINLLEARLIEAGVADEAALGAIRDEVKAVVDDAVTFADESPEPPLEELATDVYAEHAAD